MRLDLDSDLSDAEWGPAMNLQNKFADPVRNQVRATLAVPTNNNASGIGLAIFGVGTLTAGAANSADTNYLTRRARVAAVSAAAANSAAGMASIGAFASAWLFRRTGFAYVHTCGHQTISATYRWLMGLHTTAINTLAVEPSTLLNIIAIGADSGDANAQLMYNDGAGTATKVDLGADFPARTANTVFQLSLYGDVGASLVQYQIRRLDVPAVRQGVLNTDIPALGTALLPHCICANGPAGGAVTMAIMDMWASVPY